MFTVNEKPEDWGRCKVDGQIIRWTNKAQVEKHLGHRVGPLDGFHTNELIRYWLKLL